jgi:hypothetical protein
LHTIADASAPDDWHTIVAALIEFTGIFLPPPCIGALKKPAGCLFLCLQDIADDALPGMARRM